ncbi:protein of unknown function [Methylocaldum szegediense]|uniref:Uncharacterized protein n=1 Tax=Methylocaldum szegediense TaxID=73780 RepID=A0ABM9HZQ8_9GAMM|nr:protein of unknown function [Methylocaldum szegediense]
MCEKGSINGLEDRGSNLYNFDFFGPLAQSVEHCTFNAVVAGSNPARPISLFNYPGRFLRLFFCGQFT